MNSHWAQIFIISSFVLVCISGLVFMPTLRRVTQPAATIFYESFEGTSPLAHTLIVDTSHAAPHSRSYASNIAFRGKKSARIELRDSDPEIANGTRAEITFIPASKKEQWYSFAMYFPASAWAPDTYPEIISQWHAFPDEALGEQWRSPATKLLVVNDRLRLDIGYHTAKVNKDLEHEHKYDLGPLRKDAWQHFVFRIRHDASNKGEIEVWQNGSKVLKHIGGNSFNDDLLPFWKIGLYKWDWNSDNKTDVKRRVIYLDEVVIGASHARLDDFIQ